MFIKFFVEAKENAEALELVSDSLKEMGENINKQEVISVNSYWKMEDTYIVEMVIELKEDALCSFLDLYSDEWLEFGKPVDELLASENNQGCMYMRSGFMIVNIFL